VAVEPGASVSDRIELTLLSRAFVHAHRRHGAKERDGVLVAAARWLEQVATMPTH
jgi:hypothetical protein